MMFDLRLAARQYIFTEEIEPNVNKPTCTSKPEDAQ